METVMSLKHDNQIGGFDTSKVTFTVALAKYKKGNKQTNKSYSQLNVGLINIYEWEEK